MFENAPNRATAYRMNRCSSALPAAGWTRLSFMSSTSEKIDVAVAGETQRPLELLPVGDLGTG